MKYEEPLFLGIDGGGSKCRALLIDAVGNVLGEGLAGAANPLRGIEASKQAILDAYEKARIDAGLDTDVTGSVIAGVGLAGVNLPHLKLAMENWQHPFAQMHITTDLDIACLGAHDGQLGAVVIIGTGSCGLSKTEQGDLEIGGHGFLLGDKGSGAWFGLQLLQHALEASDGLTIDSQLVADVFAQAQCQSPMELVSKYSFATPKFFAEYAGLVIKHAKTGDLTAQNILSEGANYLDQLCKKLLDTCPNRLALIGGLSPFIEPYLSETVRAKLSPPLKEPQWGAIAFAKRQMQPATV